MGVLQTPHLVRAKEGVVVVSSQVCGKLSYVVSLRKLYCGHGIGLWEEGQS